MTRQRAALERSFDLWLDKELHRMFDSIAQEPLPDELVRLVDQARGGKTRPASK